MSEPSVFQSAQPAQRFVIESDAVFNRARRKWRWRMPQSNRAPDDKNHHHDRGHGHDLQCLPAGFVQTLNIFSPEIERYGDSKESCKEVVGEIPKRMA